MDSTSALLALCRAWLHNGKAAIGQIEDWAALRELAGLHRLRPLVHRQLSVQADELPEGELQWWAGEARRMALQNIQAASELVRVVEALRTAGIQPAPIKGPCLSMELYHNVSLREFSDLDLLIPGPQMLDCLAALYEMGYTIQDGSPHPPGPRQWPDYLVGNRGDMPLANPKTGVQLDLHWRLLSLNKHGDEDWRANLGPDPLCLMGRELPRFEPHFLLAYMALHGFQHGWHRLFWLVDLAVLLSRGPQWDLARLARPLLGGKQNHLIFLSSLCLAESLLEVPLLRCIRENPESRRLLGPARRLAAALAAGIARDQGEEPGQSRLLRFQLMACPGLWCKLSCLTRLAGAVGFEEVRSLRLPRGLRLLYYPYRWHRLLTKPILDSVFKPGARTDKA